MVWEDYIPSELRELYEIYDYKHAAAILSNEYQEEFKEICETLKTFRIAKEDIMELGGNESKIPKKMSQILRPLHWEEKQLTAKLVITDKEEKKEINIDTHKVDYIKGRIALDLEWNSKDQTFDRDLFAFRAFFEYDKISVGILITRSDSLEEYFNLLGKEIKKKYGASTTHMGKLIPRLNAGRNGGCPILVFGITRKIIIDE